MAYTIQVQNFEGPLDLLLQLVEGEKMEITDISLVQVTEPFLRYMEERRGKMPPEELADFLLVAAKLVYLKSKALIPSLEPDAELEGPDLATQLRTYQAFVAAAKHLQVLSAQGVRSFSHPRRMLAMDDVHFVAPEITKDELKGLFALVVRRLEPILRLPQAAIERVMTLEEKMSQLVERVRVAVTTSFRAMAHEATSRAELIVTFLAMLELAKQRTISVKQAELFEDIHISHV